MPSSVCSVCSVVKRERVRARMEPELTTTIAQLGAAGLMGWMWLSERRAAAVREKQLDESHDRLMQERTSLEVVLRTIESSTRVLTAIEVGQRQLLDVLGRLAPTRAAATPMRANETANQAPAAGE